MWQISPHPVHCRMKMTEKYTLSHKNFAKIHCFKRTLKGVLPHDTLSHNFLINCDTLSHNFAIIDRRPFCRGGFRPVSPVSVHRSGFQTKERMTLFTKIFRKIKKRHPFVLRSLVRSSSQCKSHSEMSLKA